MVSPTSITCSFISCSCSKTPCSVDWNYDNGWIVFGSSRNVALISPADENKAPVIAGTFCEHDGDVTCVKWIKNTGYGDGESFAVSGGTDSRTVLWSFNDGRLIKVGIGSGHSMPVTHVCGIKIDSSCLISTCSADSTMRIWSWNELDRKEGDAVLKEMQVIPIAKSGFSLCCDMHSVADGILLASGHDDKKIHLYWKSASTQEFVEVMTLEGHNDWIRGISFQPTGSHLQPVEAGDSSRTSLLLASSSQDSYVRIWRVDGLHGVSEDRNGSIDGAIQLKRQLFTVDSLKGTLNCTVTLDAVLSGHEDWVYSVQWHPEGKSRLLTASMDKCLVVWEPDERSGLWLEKARLGVVGGPVASGFYGGLFGPHGAYVLGHTFQGGLHVWREVDNEWVPMVFPGGHSGPVEDICWDVNGHYLLSCSADQTTRLYTPWVREDGEVTIHEIARPQVHGYDMQAVVSVNSSCFVSCSEEKILRAFCSTKAFAENLVRITNLPENETMNSLSQGLSTSMADGACVPSLGLSNKAMFIGETANTDDLIASAMTGDGDAGTPFQPAELRVPPTEDCLMQNTLWPEVHKLYGHGCEVFAIACNHAGTVIASAAKANKPDQAQVILWSTSDWQQRAQLSGHSLTVTQIAFSPDDAYLLTVSRDRTWCLYRRNGDDFRWDHVGNSDKKTAVHSRIIWSCAWTSDSKYFITVSRDKKIVAWTICDHPSDSPIGIVRQVGSVMEAPNSVTAVAIAPREPRGECFLVAIGLESGEIILYKWNRHGSFEHLYSMDRSMAHCLTVKRLQFYPRLGPSACSRLWSGSENENVLMLASCSDDHSVKVFRIDTECLMS